MHMLSVPLSILYCANRSAHFVVGGMLPLISLWPHFILVQRHGKGSLSVCGSESEGGFPVTQPLVVLLQ